MEIVLRAANMLNDGLIKNEIEIQDLLNSDIGHMVNNIRKNNKENGAGILCSSVIPILAVWYSTNEVYLLHFVSRFDLFMFNCFHVKTEF